MVDPKDYYEYFYMLYAAIEDKFRSFSMFLSVIFNTPANVI